MSASFESYNIKPLNQELMAGTKTKLGNLAKPPGSLGELEEIAIKLSGISGQTFYDTKKRCVIVFASDNGVVEESVSLAPQGVTAALALGFARGMTGCSVLAKQFGADVIVVDVGINGDISHSFISNRKIRKSTWNMSRGPAMSRDEAITAINIGIETAIAAVENGYKLFGVGEIGIGNTTTSAAVLCVLCGIQPEQATGKGAGLSAASYKNKIDAIKRALTLNSLNILDPIDVVSKVGGFDIAAMAGAYLGAAHKGVPVVVDGFISMTAALVAYRLNPLVKDYMFASHASSEPGFKIAAESIGLMPCLNLNMRLGEGSGCPIMFAIIDAACAVLREMGTFDEVCIEESYVEAVKDESFHIRGL